MIHIITGGAYHYIRPHFTSGAPGRGETGKMLGHMFRGELQARRSDMQVMVHNTHAAGGPKNMTTNADIRNFVQSLVAIQATRMVVLAAALADYEPVSMEMDRVGGYGHWWDQPVGRSNPRLETRLIPEVTVKYKAAEKVLPIVRKERKDIYLVGFSASSNFSADEQYIKGLNTLKEASANLVFANDDVTGQCMVITPEEARYGVSKDRDASLCTLVTTALDRYVNHFTRTTVVPGDVVSFGDPRVPQALRDIVSYLVAKGAYQPFRGVTAGHFAVKIDSLRILTTRRKTDFNRLFAPGEGLVECHVAGPDHMKAFGFKPSVGGQSQRIVFQDHKFDCIVHFHCMIRATMTAVDTAVVPQRPYECGSHECGNNTSAGMKYHILPSGDVIGCTYLDNHGPNIMFNPDVSVPDLIDFIEERFDLSRKTGGPVALRT